MQVQIIDERGVWNTNDPEHAKSIIDLLKANKITAMGQVQPLQQPFRNQYSEIPKIPVRCSCNKRHQTNGYNCDGNCRWQ
ncbi:MAG: hypothetical protein AAB649_06225 [Patescibacteria group bacterium]